MHPDRTAELVRLLRQRILVMDGAMGTMLQQCKLTADDFRGHFHDHAHELAGDNDLLVLTKPDVVQAVQQSRLPTPGRMASSTSSASAHRRC